MTVQNIEKQALGMDVRSRAKLAKKLLLSLDELSEEENEKLWMREAYHRHEELVNGIAKSRSASEVIQSTRIRLK